MLPLTIRKLGYFWLSTAQLFSTQGLTRAVRAGRALAVLAYWLLLVLAVAGGWALWRRNQKIAGLLGTYVVLLTLMHVAFVMNTRYRAPLMDPLLVTLAGGGLLGVCGLWRGRGQQALATGGGRLPR